MKTVSENKKRGRPSSHNRDYVSIIKSLFPEVTTERGILNHYHKQVALAVIKEQPNLDDYLWVISTRFPGSFWRAQGEAFMALLTLDQVSAHLKISNHSLNELMLKGEIKPAIWLNTEMHFFNQTIYGEKKECVFEDHAGVFEIKDYSDMVFDANGHSDYGGIKLVKNGSCYLVAVRALTVSEMVKS